jgi:hypothetical protein
LGFRDREKMNKNKKGKPFEIPDSFIKLLVTSIHHHFVYLTDKPRVLSMLKENVYYYQPFLVTAISVKESTS